MPSWWSTDSVFTTPARTNKHGASKRSETESRQWVGVNLGKLRMVSEVRLYLRDDSGNEGRGFPVDFKVEVSLDGEQWKTVAVRSGIRRSKKGQIVELAVFQFTPRTAAPPLPRASSVADR